MARSGKTEEQMPWLLQQWRAVYLSLPRLHIPSSDLEFSTTILSALALFTVKVMGEQVLINTFGWPDELAKEAAGSIGAIAHSITLVPALCCLLWTQPYVPSSKMSSAPQWWQDCGTAALQFCTGYMIYDAIVNIILFRWPNLSASDWMFLGHHFATTFYMTSTRIIGAGHISAFICMLTGEATNPLHNSFMIAQLAKTIDCCDGPIARQVIFWIELLFSGMYVLFRVVIGPLAMLHVTYDLLLTKAGRQNIPLALRIVFMIMIWGVVFGSVPWIQDCTALFQEHMGWAQAEAIGQEL